MFCPHGVVSRRFFHNPTLTPSCGAKSWLGEGHVRRGVLFGDAIMTGARMPKRVALFPPSDIYPSQPMPQSFKAYQSRVS